MKSLSVWACPHCGDTGGVHDEIAGGRQCRNGCGFAPYVWEPGRAPSLEYRGDLTVSWRPEDGQAIFVKSDGACPGCPSCPTAPREEQPITFLGLLDLYRRFKKLFQ